MSDQQQAPGQRPEAPILWRHPDPSGTPLARFMRHVSQRHPELTLECYRTLYEWSIDDIAGFWAAVWDFCGVRHSKTYDHVLPPASSSSPSPSQQLAMYPRPDFFAGARLNFAENLLYPAGAGAGAGDGDGKDDAQVVDEAATAVISVTERPGERRDTTWAELREAVRRCAAALRAAGLRPGDVVAGFVSNHVESVVGMLAAAAAGAVWTGISPDTGVSAVLDRLAQIGPRVLLADNGVVYNGKEWPGAAKTVEVAAALAASSASASSGGGGGRRLELVVVIDALRGAPMALDELRACGVGRAEAWDDFLAGAPADEPLRFEPLPPSHPLYILYSSGTTGLPKAIVHTAAGTLLQHKKELHLHCSMTPASRMLFYSTPSWMMWHWSVSALAVGASVVLYAGSPFRPHGDLSMARLLSDLRVTHFGTSAAYLVTLEAHGVRFSSSQDPDHPDLDLSALEAVYSTASPLPPSTFAYVYEAFPPAVHLGSITGGTDIISLFGAPCPLLPVRVGEIQCAGLGMAVDVVDSASADDDPRPVDPPDAPGELVCVRPFPSQPLTFFGEGGDDKYRAAYFERFRTTARGPIWAHGDFVSFTDPGVRGLRMLGRSDGVLKPAGVRFGSAEIYNILTKFLAATVADAVCVGRRRPDVDADETVCLFLVMREGCAFVPGETDAAVRRVVREQLSPRHVPAVVDECGPEGVPLTGNGKKIEVAVKQILSGLPVRTNASVANPAALEWFRAWAVAHP